MPETKERSRTVYERLAGVFSEIPAIAKSQRNIDQGYAARSIDDLYDALHELFARHGVRPVFQTVDHRYEWLESSKGNRLCQVFVTVDIWFVDDQGEETSTPIRVVSEGRDASDKASNKALSGAMKYALIHAFLIPVTGEDDADLRTVEGFSVFRQKVNAAKTTVFEAANQDRTLAASAWGDALSTYGLVDETAIETLGGEELLSDLVDHAVAFVEETGRIKTGLPSKTESDESTSEEKTDGPSDDATDPDDPERPFV